MSTYRSIPEWEGLYSVNDLGQVWSDRNSLELKSSVNPCGYRVVTLSDKATSRRQVALVHRLVAIAFLGVPAHKVVCHIDGDSTNNSLTNLRVDTMKSNSLDMVKHGRAGRVSKLSDEVVAKIRQSTASNSSLAKVYGVTANYIYMIKSGRKRTYSKEANGKSSSEEAP